MSDERVMQYNTWQEAFVDTKAHAKSNTKQITEIKETLKCIENKLDKNGEITNMIKTVVVDNGLCASLKKQESDLSAIREDFTQYKIHRMDTCPISHAAIEKRNWTVTVLKVVFAGIGLLSTIVVVLQYAKELI